MQQNEETRQSILGIDLGTNSIGWALLETKDEKPAGILARGVRVFEAGFEGMEMDGRGKSRAVARREARRSASGGGSAAAGVGPPLYNPPHFLPWASRVHKDRKAGKVGSVWGKTVTS